jgi:hypothetical protein
MFSWLHCFIIQKMVTRILSVVAFLQWFIDIWTDISVNCNWVDTQWQQYSYHLHTNHTQNTINLVRVRAVPCLWELYPGTCLTTEEKGLTVTARHLHSIYWLYKCKCLFNGYIGIFPWGSSAWGVKLTPQFRLVPKLRMCGAIPKCTRTHARTHVQWSVSVYHMSWHCTVSTYNSALL